MKLFDNWMSRFQEQRGEEQAKEAEINSLKEKAKREALAKKRQSEEARQPQKGPKAKGNPKTTQPQEVKNVRK